MAQQGGTTMNGEAYKSYTDKLLLMLMAIVVLVLIADAGLFLRMNQLQEKLLGVGAQPPGGEASSEPSGLSAGTLAPAFVLTDTLGSQVALSSFAGQPVLLAFTSTSCSACKRAYPQIKTFSETRSDIRTVMISMGSEQENRQLIVQQGFRFPILAWTEPVAEQYQVPGTPFFYVIDGQGMITNSGFASTADEIAQLVSGRGKSN